MSHSTSTTGTTAAALTALQSFQKVAEQAEAIAERVASATSDDDFPAAVRELNHLKLTTQATAAVWHTLDDLAETLLSRPRK